MSNRVNAAIANAWFQADVAVERYDIYNKKQEAIEEYNELLEDVTEHQESEAQREGIFSLAGNVIGSAVGFIVGGPAGAVAGWGIGGGVGEFAAGVTDDEQGLIDLQTQIENFDWQLAQTGYKYDALSNLEWEDEMEDKSELAGDAIEQWRDDYYDPWHEDLINDIAIPLMEQYTIGQIDAFAAENFDWYHAAKFEFQDTGEINPNTGLPYVYE